jgi:hypothetical protein
MTQTSDAHEFSVMLVPPDCPSPPPLLLAERARSEMTEIATKPRNWAMKRMAKIRSFHLRSKK